MTHIIATVGPQSEHIITELAAAGVDIFRLNISHSTRQWHTTMIQHIRERAPDTKIMIDHRGPEIQRLASHRYRSAGSRTR